jgi:chemotaxis response regulator CheB
MRGLEYCLRDFPGIQSGGSNQGNSCDPRCHVVPPIGGLRQDPQEASQELPQDRTGVPRFVWPRNLDSSSHRRGQDGFRRRTQIATHGEVILPGHVYLAPDGFHLHAGAGGRVWLTSDEPENGICPSVSRLFQSVADTYGRRAIGLLLSGMGKDGAKELGLMKEKGAVTLVQDKATSVVHGMPGEALRLGAATCELSPEKIVEALITLVSHHKRRSMQ